MSGVGTPTRTTVPVRSRGQKASRLVSGRLTGVDDEPYMQARPEAAREYGLAALLGSR